MLMPNSNIANFDAGNLNTVVEIACDEDYVIVYFHGKTLEQYAFENRRRAGRRSSIGHGGMQHIANMMLDASSILSTDGFKRLLIDNGFAKVQ